MDVCGLVFDFLLDTKGHDAWLKLLLLFHERLCMSDVFHQM